MTNKKEMTSAELHREIRLLCDLPTNGNKWFSRTEIKTIAKKLSPAARFISDDRESSKYLSSVKVFPKYVKGWITQETVNDHPVKQNLLNIYKLLSKPKQEFKSKVVVSKNKTQVITAKNRLNQMLSYANELSRAKKVLIHPDNTIEIILGGKHDK